MRLLPFLGVLPFALQPMACSSSDGSSSGPEGAGGYYPGTGGFYAAGGFYQAAGGTPSVGGAPLGSGGGGGFGAGGASGAAGVSGAAGSLSTEGGVGGVTGDSGAATDGGLSPTPVLCADPTEKKCGGPCVKPGPADGCSLVTCVECPSVTNGVEICASGRCGFECNPGFAPAGGACAAGDAGDAGTGVPDGSSCGTGADCTSQRCVGGRCQPALCTDGIQNGRETDVDCGGNCGACAPGKKCGSNPDCAEGPCQSGTCGCTAYACGDPALAGRCGTALDDHCGGTVSCGCGSGQACFQGACCDPQAVCQTSCGVVSACGTNIDCGLSLCSSGQTCNAGACCTPLKACPSSVCGSISDGCGARVTCAGCTLPQTCGGAGVSGQCGCGDGDKDGLDDCVEANDGDPWTDAAIFNGLEASLDTDGGGNCDEISTYNQMSGRFTNPAEVKNMYAGWDFSTNDDAANAPGFGFTPSFTSSDTQFRVRYRGLINLPQAGQYCFKVDAGSTGGRTPDECGQIYFEPVAGGAFLAENGYNGPTSEQTRCVTTTAGAHAMEFVFQSFNTSHLHTLHFSYCFGNASSCTPSTPLTQKNFRLQ